MKNLFLFVLAISSFACVAPDQGTIKKNETNLTPGMITIHIEKGKSTQKDVLEVFGPPDLVTKEDDTEMWGYDRVSREVAYGSFGIGILGGGLPGSAFIGGGVSAKQGYTSQTTKTVFLLVYFRKNIVVDYKLSATKF